ncbi:MAG: hypothetical protein QOE72_949 [Chloroflexota bacterium]|jgi:hypothetical protein|nr:hypothetical protein [Chloroflexota bacterium]
MASAAPNPRDRSDLHRLVDELPDDAVDGAAVLLRSIKSRRIEPDQAWFWTPEWQEGEREVDEAIARGEHGTIYVSDEEFISALEKDLKPLEP